MQSTMLNQLITMDATIKPSVLKNLICYSNRSPSEVTALAEQILTEASEAFSKKNLDQMVYVDLVSELESVLVSYYLEAYKRFHSDLPVRSQAEIFFSKKGIDIVQFLSFDSNGQLIDTLNEVDNYVIKNCPTKMAEWEDFSSSFLAGYQLIFKMIDAILQSTKVNNSFDESKLKKVLDPLVTYDRWSIIKVLLDMEGKKFPVNIKKDSATLVDWADESVSRMAKVVLKYLIVLGCDFNQNKNGKFNVLKIFKSDLTNVYDALLNPSTTVPFFSHLPEEVKLAIALKTLRATDPDLLYIPDKLLSDALYNNALHLHTADKGMAHQREVAVLLAVRKFRNYYPAPMNKDVTLDKRDVLKTEVDKRLPDCHFGAGERKVFAETFHQLANHGSYMTKPNIKNSLDLFAKQLKIIESIVDDACVFYNDMTKKSISPLEKQDLLDKFTIAIAKDIYAIDWNNKDSRELCTVLLVDLIDKTINTPTVSPNPTLFKPSNFIRNLEMEKVEAMVQQILHPDIEQTDPIDLRNVL